MALFNNDNQTGPLSGQRIAILATKGFEQAELLEPQKALKEAGARVEVVAPESGIDTGKIRAWNKTDWGQSVEVDTKLADANPADFDALVLPGGAMNPDHLRMDPEAVRFAKAFFEAGKPVGAICHAAWTLIEADVVRGRTLTSWPSLHTDLKNAGASWVDQEVVEDGNLVSSRKPEDLPAFNQRLIQVFSKATQPVS